jgi:hypothetical protein
MMCIYSMENKYLNYKKNFLENLINMNKTVFYNLK